tara:strand:+ start:34 stop:426 length:393 start_codon:yes stop_codon:yes gene_type:complete
MIDKALMVDNFHKVFKIKTREKPSLIPKEEWELRYDMILEELKEYKKACEDGDLVEIADALTDMDFLVNGGYSIHGMINTEQETFEEVFDSNMSKLDENGEPIFRNDGKVLKGKNYFKPNIKKILDDSRS